MVVALHTALGQADGELDVGSCHPTGMKKPFDTNAWIETGARGPKIDLMTGAFAWAPTSRLPNVRSRIYTILRHVDL